MIGCLAFRGVGCKLVGGERGAEVVRCQARRLTYIASSKIHNLGDIGIGDKVSSKVGLLFLLLDFIYLLSKSC